MAMGGEGIRGKQMILGGSGMSHFFLSVFFALAFGAGLLSGSTLGRPLTPASRIASKSALRYMPVGPIYRNGLIPFLWSLFFTPSDVMPKAWDISSIVISSIMTKYKPSHSLGSRRKWQNVPIYRYFTTHSYSSLAKKMQISNFFLGRPLTTHRAWGML